MDYTKSDKKIDLLYLDSWDVDWINPMQSAIHGLNEFSSILNSLRTGSIVLIDDTPVSASIMERVHPKYIQNFLEFKEKYGFFPGKGALVKMLIELSGKHEIIAHEYQLLIAIKW
ncbi:MAG: hypothetical protein HQ490_05375 [Lutibacter sp.]|nr:hypothetical protein [Lutibacter sp.]